MNEGPEVRGGRCRTLIDLFAVWSEALGFPDYFGHNWDAFEECLFSVVESGPVTVVVHDADQLLADEDPRQLSTFLAIVDAVGKEGRLSLKAGPAA
ncbi:barstar family protein [Streptomyces sp. DG2A-72]|uniref:barstar family protein n=1 Tax=Streptomyces sp. DG2A-72 TaxID=3051386 RepID=UPI00265C45B6|nr:barstar family protein [Streptomyces sp. DG2A-72]MDO0933901.1 barstar family protein [Streptomyces sp. DG2A-72]